MKHRSLLHLKIKSKFEKVGFEQIFESISARTVTDVLGRVQKGGGSVGEGFVTPGFVLGTGRRSGGSGRGVMVQQGQ